MLSLRIPLLPRRPLPHKEHVSKVYFLHRELKTRRSNCGRRESPLRPQLNRMLQPQGRLPQQKLLVLGNWFLPELGHIQYLARSMPLSGMLIVKQQVKLNASCLRLHVLQLLVLGSGQLITNVIQLAATHAKCLDSRELPPV